MTEELDKAKVDFDAPDLAGAVEALSPDEVDQLPFGAIRLDVEERVVLYSKTEREQSGSGGRERLGRGFFSEIAPCMDTESFRGRARRAQAAGRLDVQFTHYGDFDDRDRQLTVRLQSASDGGLWIFMRREG